MAENRVARVKAEHLKNMDTATTTGKIVSVSANSESLIIDIGSTTVQVAHPFVSGKSWIRTMPSVGTTCTLAFNAAQNRYEFVAYAPSQSAASIQLENYANRKSLYRVLKEGEIEFASSGGVTLFMGSRPVHAGRAGAVTWKYDSDKLEATATAPTHVVRGHNNKTDRIGNEMRFGVVKRPTSSTSETYALTAPLSMPALGKYTYAYEHLLSLSNDLGAPLLDLRAGEVYDNTLDPGIPFATPILGKKSKLPLRARYRYFCTLEPGGLKTPEATDVEISCLGDLDVMLSKLAIQGFSLDAPFGAVKVKAGLNSSFISKLAILVKSEIDKIALDASTSISAKAGTSIELNPGTDLKTKAGAAQKHESATTFDLKAGTKMNINGVGINIDGTGKVTIHGAAGLSISGAAGSSSKPLPTNPIDIVTGVPLFTDPTLTS